MDTSIIEEFRSILSASQILTDADLRERYAHIWLMDIPLQGQALLLPTSTAELSSIMKVCHAHQQPVVIHGGLTNLVGATVAAENDIVISLEKMNKIEEVDTQSRTLTVQAGVILEHIQQSADQAGLMFPLNFGAKGSAQIGGVISTNAGGLRVLRYGMTRNLVLGIEAVLADGTVINSMKKIIKDNSGYDLKQLFIGSEGTLGIVTRAVLKLSESPKSRSSAFIGFNEYEKVVEFMKFADRGLAGTLSGYELIWKNTFIAMSSPPALVGPPMSTDYNYYVLIESLGSDQFKDHDTMENLLTDALENDLILDAVMAHSEADMSWFWGMREDVGVFATLWPFTQHFDISIPIPTIGAVIDQMVVQLNQLPEVHEVYCFGHVADGNIHLVVGKQTDAQSLTERINNIVYSPLQELGGSISAEHGIGLDKKAYLPLSRNSAELQLMRTLKKALDPSHILNPNRIFDGA